MEFSEEQKSAANNNIPLFDLASRDTALKRAGREYKGACPFCGGRDRFYVKPEANVWGCRNCSPKYHDALAYVMRRDSLNFMEAVKRYTNAPLVSERPVNRPAPQPAPAPVKYPSIDTQETLRAIVQQGRDNLRRADAAQQYLEQRGILDSADRFQLGYSPEFQVQDIHVPAGIMFPHLIGGRIWAVKIRRLPHFTKTCRKCHDVIAVGERCSCKETANPKNLFVWREHADAPVNKPALYNADALLNAETAIVCEGEIDCITLSQELGWPVVTLGGVSNTLDLAMWSMYLASLRRVYVVKDNDAAGQRLTWAAEVFGRKAVDAPLPAGVKDPNDLLVKHDKLFGWAVKHLLTHEQQAKFSSAWQETKAWNASERGAVRLAWLKANGRSVDADCYSLQPTPTPAAQMITQTAAVAEPITPVALTPPEPNDVMSEPEYPFEQQWPGRNYDYALGVAYAIGNVTRDGLQYLMLPRPVKWTGSLFCAWICETPESAQTVITRLRLRQARAYQVTITKNQHGMLRFER